MLDFFFSFFLVLSYGVFVGFPNIEGNGTLHHTCHKTQQIHFKAFISMAHGGAMSHNWYDKKFNKSPDFS